MLQGKIVRVGAVPASPTNVITHAVFGNVLQRVVQCLDAHGSELTIFLDARSRDDHVVSIWKSWIVDLENEAGVYDCLVFVFDSIRQSKNVFLFGGIVFVVEEVLQPAGGKHAHESFFWGYISFRHR